MPLFIEWLLAGLSRIFSTRLGGWLASAMVFFGIQFATTTISFDVIKNYIGTEIGHVGGAGLDWLVFFNIPRYVSIIVSAYTAGAAVGALKRVSLVRAASGGSSS